MSFGGVPLPMEDHIRRLTSGLNRTGSAGLDASQARVTPPGLDAGRTLAARASDLLSLDDYPGLHRDGEHDDSAPLARAIADASKRRAALRIPAGGPVLLGGGTALPPLDGVALLGDLVPAEGPPYGRRGSCIWITDEARTAFPLASNWHVSGLNFFWPRQTERNAPPIPYPPLFAPAAEAGGCGAGVMRDLRVTNAYDFFVADGPHQTSGDIVMDALRVYAVRDCFRLRQVPEVFQVSNSLFSFESFDAEVLQYGRRAPSFALRDFTTSQGSWLHVVGDGTPARGCATSAGLLTSNVFVYGYGRGFWADCGVITGRYNETSFDGVPRVLQVDPGGSLGAFHHHGGIVYCYRPGFQDSQASTAWVIRDPCPDRNGRPLCQIAVTDVEIGFADGSLFDIEGLNVQEVKLALKAARYGRLGHGFGVRIKAPNAAFELTNTGFVPAHGGLTGVRIEGPSRLASLVGNRFYGLDAPVQLDGPGLYHLAANASVGTTGARSVTGEGVAAAVGGGNFWDRA